MEVTTHTEAVGQEGYRGLENPLIVGRGKLSDPRANAAWAESMLHWHYQGDPLAETVALRLREQGAALGQPAAAVRLLARQGDTACRRFLEDMEAVPEWVDFEVMRSGGAMIQRHFPHMILALTYGVLPLTFGHPDAAAIFVGTGRLEANVTRRLNESAALFFKVSDSDALAPGGRVWETCLHVRLVHALVRMRCLEQGWDVQAQGMPVSQLATAAGPAFFGAQMLDCMRLLGARISEEEAAGHHLVWRYTTRLMGVPETLLGRSQQEQDDFDAALMSQFFAPDDNARTVMAALLKGLSNQRPTSRLPRHLHAALFRYLLGDEEANAFGIPSGRAGERLLFVLRSGLSGYAGLQRVPGMPAGLRWLGKLMLSRLSREGLVSPASAGTAH